MEPTNSKLLLWLLSFVRDRESSSSGDSDEAMRAETFVRSCQNNSALLVYCSIPCANL